MVQVTCPGCGSCFAHGGTGPVPCPSCGFDVDPPSREAERVDLPEAPAEASPDREDRWVGQDRDPVLVVVLAFITLGLYGLLWLWETSREIDRHVPEGSSAHEMVRIGLLALAGAVAAVVVGIVAILTGSVPRGGPATLLLAGGGMLFLVAVLLGLIGGVLQLVGHWRIWSKMQDRERDLGIRDPIDPVLHLVLVLIPIVNIVGFWIVLYRTQDHLNEIWARSA